MTLRLIYKDGLPVDETALSTIIQSGVEGVGFLYIPDQHYITQNGVEVIALAQQNPDKTTSAINISADNLPDLILALCRQLDTAGFERVASVISGEA